MLGAECEQARVGIVAFYGLDHFGRGFPAERGLRFLGDFGVRIDGENGKQLDLVFGIEGRTARANGLLLLRRAFSRADLRAQFGANRRLPREFGPRARSRPRKAGDRARFRKTGRSTAFA